MTALAARPLTAEDVGSCLAADPFSLAEANINPVTGLSTDYLNHFHEAAYDLADPLTRSEFDELCDAMTASVTAARDSMQPNLSREAMAGIAGETAAWLKPLVARASAIIHGSDPGAGDAASIAEFQAAIDAVLKR